MKTTLLAIIATGISLSAFSQDSTQQTSADTIRIGGMVIVKDKKGSDSTEKDRDFDITISNRNKDRKRNSAVTTNWWIVDLGFANWNDNTDYAAAQASGFVDAGIGEDHLKLRTGKSVNVNIWFFMQKLKVIKSAVNLKYGLGLELNNYRFDDKRLMIQENPTKIVLHEEWKDIDKNKLAADYITVPLMININFTPKREKGFSLSGGVSAGYLYSARQKIKDGGDKEKFHDDYDLNKFKLAYIGELGLGPVKLYGSYAMKSMWDKGLDQTPYAIGLRLSTF